MGKKENRPVACAASGTASTCDYDSTFVSAGQDMTENGLIRTVTEEYLAGIDVDIRPAPEDVERELLQATNNAIEAYNLGPRDPSAPMGAEQKDAYLDGLEAKRREVEKSLANLVKVIESGLISETVTERLVQLEEQKRALNEAIEAENIRAALCEDEHTIKAYFEKFLHADFDNPETRDQVLEYFVDKIYLTDDGLVVTSWYSEDRTEVTWDMLYGEDGNPFVKGEAVKFDCFPFGSTT